MKRIDRPSIRGARRRVSWVPRCCRNGYYSEAAENTGEIIRHQCQCWVNANIAGVDPHSGQLVRLFHPRQDRWSEHFQWQGASLLGKTPIGRVTIQVLAMNAHDQQIVREELLQEGRRLDDV
jgi:hypothetical protein